jgi:hypothetical protein
VQRAEISQTGKRNEHSFKRRIHRERIGLQW